MKRKGGTFMKGQALLDSRRNNIRTLHVPTKNKKFLAQKRCFINVTIIYMNLNYTRDKGPVA